MSDTGGHYYLRGGKPCHTVPKKFGGGVRNFDLRWDRHLDAAPSVTTVLRVIDKPQLTAWQVRQGILSTLTFPSPRAMFESDDAYVQAILDDSKQQVIDAANEGSRIHSALEDHFAGRVYPERYQLHVEATLELIAELFPGVNDWVSEARFTHPLGYGGACDLHSPSTGIIVDFKGKDGDFSDGKRLGYDQYLQFAAYQNGFNLPPNTGTAIFVSRTHPGKVAHHQWSADEMAQGWEIFKAALKLWQLTKGYKPSWAV